ncbi:MAG: hypothetical protein N7Q72_01280, partial [Spiroplasma sp. Tabriz.8]|nr:hypothetical protein [Spiroplasma sp. Tabriz.8]
ITFPNALLHGFWPTLVSLCAFHYFFPYQKDKSISHSIPFLKIIIIIIIIIIISIMFMNTSIQSN